MRYERQISDGDLFRDIKRVAKRHGGTITVVVYMQEGRYGMKTIAQRFGSWRRAVLLAGITPYYERNPLTMRGPNDRDEQRAAMIESRNVARKRLVDGAKTRTCNRCDRDFMSTWSGNRRCPSCERLVEREGASVCDDERGLIRRAHAMA